MKIALKIVLILFSLTIFGCAVPPADKSVTSQSVYKTIPVERKVEKTITLECPSAHKLGCRHKGRVYPWNAWVAMRGYRTSEYAIVDVQQSGPRAKVLLVSP